MPSPQQNVPTFPQPICRELRPYGKFQPVGCEQKLCVTSAPMHLGARVPLYHFPSFATVAKEGREFQGASTTRLSFSLGPLVTKWTSSCHPLHFPHRSCNVNSYGKRRREPCHIESGVPSLQDLMPGDLSWS